MQYFKVCSTTCTQRVFEVSLYFQNSNVLRIFYYFLQDRGEQIKKKNKKKLYFIGTKNESTF